MGQRERAGEGLVADMKAHLSALFFLVLASAQGVSLAAEADQLKIVAMAGHWEHEGKSGVFRLVLSEAGLEQAMSSLLAEWVEDPTASTPSPQVRSSVYLFRDFMAIFNPPKIKVYKNRVRVSLAGWLGQESGPRVICTFDLLADGKVRVVSECR